MSQSALESIRTVENLKVVWTEFRKRSGKSAGIDGITSAAFAESLGRNLAHISEAMRVGYKFSRLRGVVLSKKDNKTRLICVPTIADRIVQRAILRKIETRAEKLGIVNDVSFGFVKPQVGAKRGTHAASKAALRLRAGHPWVLKADISAFFDTIDRGTLLEDLRRMVKMSSLHELLGKVIACEVDPDNRCVRRSISENDIREGVGLRQGMPLSPIFSNFVLRSFDRVIGASRAMVRYADDMLVFGASKAECEYARALVEGELAKIGLSLSDAKTKICGPEDPVEFLGMEISRRREGASYSLIVSEQQQKQIRAAFRGCLETVPV